MVEKCVYLRKLDLCSCFQLNGECVASVAKYCRNLVEFAVLQSFNINNALCIEHLLIKCTKLKLLEWSSKPLMSATDKKDFETKYDAELKEERYDDHMKKFILYHIYGWRTESG